MYGGGGGGDGGLLSGMEPTMPAQSRQRGEVDGEPAASINHHGQRQPKDESPAFFDLTVSSDAGHGYGRGAPC